MNKPVSFLLGSLLVAGALPAKDFKPGDNRWEIKTSISGRAFVDDDMVIAFEDFVALPDPVPNPKKNDPEYQKKFYPEFENKLELREGDIVTVRGWLHLVALEDDGDYRIQFSNDPELGYQTIMARVPLNDIKFVKSPILRARLNDIRQQLSVAATGFVYYVAREGGSTVLKRREAAETGTIIFPAMQVEVTGQLFYDNGLIDDLQKGKKGMRVVTHWTLHPVSNLKFIQ